jgi:hypothetical protein
VSGTTTSTNATRNKLVADAQSLPALIATAKTDDPALYTALTGSNDKAVWLAPATSAVAWVAGRYGFNWDANTCSTVALVAGSLVLAAWHWLAPRIVPGASFPSSAPAAPKA